MPSNGTTTVNDGTTDLVFSPMRIKGDVASYANLAESPEIARQTLALKMTDKAQLRNVTGIVVFPRVIDEEINGVTVSKVADYVTSKQEYIVPKTWDETDIASARKWAADLFNETIPAGMVDRGEFVW